jgi:hypothetical protein
MLAWAAFGAEWALAEKVSFNGVTKRITVNAGVTVLDIREDVYSAWVRWIEREDNARFKVAMRVSGFDPIPGGFTGATYFMTNGWKLEYDANVVAVNGVLYSDDFATPYWSAQDLPIYPATVSSLVNSAVITQNVVTGNLDDVPTKEEIASQVRTTLAEELARIIELAKIHGLVSGSPLTVTPTSRSAGGINQTVTENGEAVTVARA